MHTCVCMYGAIYKYCIRPNDFKFQEIMSLRNIETLKNSVFSFKKSMKLPALHDSLFHVCIYVCIGVIYTLLPFFFVYTSSSDRYFICLGNLCCVPCVPSLCGLRK